jgi:hypothetical protein
MYYELAVRLFVAALCLLGVPTVLLFRVLAVHEVIASWFLSIIIDKVLLPVKETFDFVNASQMHSAAMSGDPRQVAFKLAYSSLCADLVMLPVYNVMRLCLSTFFLVPFMTTQYGAAFASAGAILSVLQFALLVRDTRFITSEMVCRTAHKSVISTNSSVTSANSKVSAAASRTKMASIAASRAKASSSVLPEDAEASSAAK